MKSLIRAYVDPRLEDRIKILANKSDTSVSALVSELLSQALNQTEPNGSDASSQLAEEQFYLQYFILTLLLSMHKDLNETQYQNLKEQAREWAKNKTIEVTNYEKPPF